MPAQRPLTEQIGATQLGELTMNRFLKLPRLLLAQWLLGSLTGFSKADDWLQFRGPNSTGVANTKSRLAFDPAIDQLWKIDLPGPGSSSPIVVGDHLYWCSQGNAFCASCQTGELIYKEPLTGGTKGHAFDYPSPILVGSKILIVYKTGDFSVITAQPNFEKNLEASITGDGDRFNATPAVSNDQLFIRSDWNLFAFKLHAAEK